LKKTFDSSAEEEREDKEEEDFCTLDRSIDMDSTKMSSATKRQQQRLFRVFTRKEAEESYKKAIEGLTTVLYCEEDLARYLLHAFGAKTNKIHDAYFGDEERTKQKLGLLTEEEEEQAEKNDVLKLAVEKKEKEKEKERKMEPAAVVATAPPPTRRTTRSVAKTAKAAVVPEEQKEKEAQVKCGICFEDFPVSKVSTASCRVHPFCDECWEGYCDSKLQEGKTGILDVRCPDHGCGKRVSTKKVLRFLGDAEKVAKYHAFELEHFLEQNSAVKHCPAAGCDRFLLLENKDGLTLDQIQSCVCECGKVFCWKCQEDEHIPVRCDTAQLWIAKNSSESENQNWILTFTKPCPKCSRPIEKNQGCMHMTCSQCRYDFCWTCLEPWSKHGESTGGYYSCNAFRTTGASDPSKVSEKERAVNEKKRLARMAIERYSHYHERWASHEDAEKRAKKDMETLIAKKLDDVGRNHGAGPGEMTFAVEAQRQIIECRKLLKWTYAHAYYAYNEEENDADWKRNNPFTQKPTKLVKQEQEFYEYVQGEAENRLEQLTRFMERDLEDFGNYDQSDYAQAVEHKQKEAEGEKDLQTPRNKEDRPIILRGDGLSFEEFKRKVCELTSLTKKSFETLSNQIHKGFGSSITNGTPPLGVKTTSVSKDDPMEI
jgi:ariadne-1